MPLDNRTTVTDIELPEYLNFDVINAPKHILHQGNGIKYKETATEVIDQWGGWFQDATTTYKPVMYADQVALVKESLIIAGLEYEPCEIKWNYTANGGQMSLHLTFPQMLITPQVGDAVAFRVTVYNSYDSSAVLQQIAEALRLACLNGMVRGDSVYSTKRKHTTNIDLNKEAVKVQLGIEAFYDSESRYQRWTRIPVLTYEVEKLFKATLTKKKGGKVDYTVKTFNELMLDWRRTSSTMGRTVWSAYNVATAWATHAPTESFIEAKRRERSTEVSKMLNHDLWKELEES
tara:strand:+ start:93 stop:962 length:870 start_codon:yes stop_codon:yes gene_type:complete